MSLPSHLKQYIVDQNYSRYTPIDQAVWRCTLRQLFSHLSETAHESYVDGLKKTGINIEEIPLIETISERLNEFGWQAIPVSGFIPPAAFMEFQSLGYLPIASDMRSIDHIFYTPAPDIVHEAAGHAPIISHPEYAEYLKQYADIANKALISSEDLDVYEAIRIFSDIKENPSSSKEEIDIAEKNLTDVSKNLTYDSELSLLSRMNWWTAEYGLIGSIENPKIYGAGLLSSIGESSSCFANEVKKIPISLDCLKYSYDITEPQPQLFVTKDFTTLKKLLNDFAETMSFKKGGIFGLKKAIQSKTVNTVELSSGLQISGILDSYKEKNEQPFYIRFSSPTQLSLNYTELTGHSKNFHSAGYSTIIDNLVDSDKNLEDFNNSDLIANEIIIGKTVSLNFKSGITLKGVLRNLKRNNTEKLNLLTFENCTVQLKSADEDELLFHPDWGVFDLGIGSTVDSVFSGPADRTQYGELTSFVVKTIPQKLYSNEEKRKHHLYQDIRDFRKIILNNSESDHKKTLTELYSSAKEYPCEWLSLLELYEISSYLDNQNGSHSNLTENLLSSLKKIDKEYPELTVEIQLGLETETKVPLLIEQ